MKQPICYLFGAGERHGRPPAPDEKNDLVIAVDGGLAYALACGARPSLAVGDFDSLRAPPPGGIDTVALPCEKDDTDMAAALREGWARGYRVFHIYGGTGGRLDHTLANLQCVADLAVRGGRGRLFDRGSVITAVHNGAIAFSAACHGVLSVFSHSDTAAGVDMWGLRYPLADATLRNTTPIGISNEFTGTPSGISVKSGTLVIIYPEHAKEVSP